MFKNIFKFSLALLVSAFVSISAKAETVITVVDWQSGVGGITNAYADFIKEFEAANPGVKVEYTQYTVSTYNEFLKPNSFIHLKTDSQFLYGYTIGIVEGEGHYLEYANPDVYNARALVENIEIKTHYENIFLKKNLPITYCKFKLQY